MGSALPPGSAAVVTMILPEIGFREFAEGNMPFAAFYHCEILHEGRVLAGANGVACSLEGLFKPLTNEGDEGELFLTLHDTAQQRAISNAIRLTNPADPIFGNGTTPAAAPANGKAKATIPDSVRQPLETLCSHPDFPKDKDERKTLLAVLCRPMKTDSDFREDWQFAYAALTVKEIDRATHRWKRRMEEREKFLVLARDAFLLPDPAAIMATLHACGVTTEHLWDLTPKQWEYALGNLPAVIAQSKSQPETDEEFDPVDSDEE